MLDPKLTTFLAVITYGSYTQAANKLHMTQPAVTQHIQKLEEHYGCQLFIQDGRGRKLTKEGEAFLHYAKMQASNEKHFISSLSMQQKSLHIGATLSIADYYLPPLLTHLCKDQDMKLHIQVANTKVLLQQLLEGNLDCAFIEGIFDRNLFAAKQFHQSNFIPVVSATHPLANQTVKPSELYAYPLILRESGSGTRAILENALAQQNDSATSFSNIWEVGSFLLIKALLKQTNAISFMYENVAKSEIQKDELCHLHIQGFSVTHDLQFVYLKNALTEKQVLSFYDTCMDLVLDTETPIF
ncbi:LysR family transcriptional regulator [Chakrabartyella piscis]|uniref:LysR family transcriptional regulator n=1 Tax=Chakrabartyella piscis TaxID=2918914 RepID=UPI002958863F|nr:LysR family transcriptional regulator [Chakrabartyella piscis]